MLFAPEFSLRRLDEVISMSSEFLWLVCRTRAEEPHTDEVLDGRRLFNALAHHTAAPQLNFIILKTQS